MVSVIALLILPLMAAALSCLPSRRVAPWVTVAASLAMLVLAVRIASEVTSAKPLVAIPAWFVVDGFSALIVLLIAFVGATAAFFSLGYMAEQSLELNKLRLYYVNYNLFLFSMLAIPVLVEPTLVWIVVELTTLCSALLVSFDNTHAALEAAWKYVVLSLMGAGIALLGFLFLFAALQAAGGGSYTWDGLAAAAPRMPPVLLQAAFLLILVGFGTKVGLVPMHTWLPDAHSQAPSPVCALLSGVETTAVLYVVLRLLWLLPPQRTQAWALTFGLISVGVAAFLLLQVRDYKRLFAYSTVEHMGIILVASGLGGASAQSGVMYQMLNHTITKSFCFYAAGAALLVVGKREIASVCGLIRTSPAAGAALLLGGLAIAGAPPFAVFLSELSIFKAGLAQGLYSATALLIVFVLIAFFGIMVHVNRMVFGGGEVDYTILPKPLPFSCVLTLIVGAVPVLVLGVYQPQALHELLRLAAASLTR